MIVGITIRVLYGIGTARKVRARDGRSNAGLWVTGKMTVEPESFSH
jgi:prolyl oligopeptidase PreP (S9A serine peptidase family)